MKPIMLIIYDLKNHLERSDENRGFFQLPDGAIHKPRL
jgi:hypothetical protein